MDVNILIKIIWYSLTIIYGLCVGSFLNVVIYRVPNKMSIVKPASHCPKCNNRIKWYDNIPVISYIILGGKCRNCKEKISIRYTIVELANALLWLLCLLRFGYGDYTNILKFFISSIASSICLCIFFIDLEHQIILDRFNITLGVLGVAYTFLDKENSILSHLIGAALGFGVFYLLGLLISKKVGKEALGGGDIKFALFSGLFIGYSNLILMVLIASITALISFIFAKNRKDAIPFGPFLTVGFITSLLYGTQIVNYYLRIIGVN